ncbi:MAG: hypothetical protein PHE55_20660 [Methylococcaceae bacterium]|nr:hypothetical protein [Methylococcaceae bacterium]
MSSTDLKKMKLSHEFTPILKKLNYMINDAWSKGIEVNVFVKKDDPFTGKAPIVCIEVFKPYVSG